MYQRIPPAVYEAGLAARGEANPLKRIGDPMALGHTVAFRYSPKSGYINGTAIPIERGSVGRTSETGDRPAHEPPRYPARSSETSGSPSRTTSSSASPNTAG